MKKELLNRRHTVLAGDRHPCIHMGVGMGVARQERKSVDAAGAAVAVAAHLKGIHAAIFTRLLDDSPHIVHVNGRRMHN